MQQILLVYYIQKMTHRQLSEEDQIKAGSLPEAIRLNVGIENVEDIIEDLTRALEKI